MNRSNKLNIIFSAPILSPDVKQQICAINELKILRKVIGGASIHRKSHFIWLANLFAKKNAKVESRIIDKEVCFRKYYPVYSHEIIYKIYKCFKSNIHIDNMYSRFDNIVAKELNCKDDFVIGREDCCIKTFEHAERIGVHQIYDLPTAYYEFVEDLVKKEGLVYPEINQNYSVEYSNSRNLRKFKEIALSKNIIVASEFVKKSLESSNIKYKSITCIPYGCESGLEFNKFENRKPVVLYVGRICMRKGVHRLLQAWKRIGAYKTHTLRLIGKMLLPKEMIDNYCSYFEHIPHMPKSQLIKHYSESLFLVFPTLSDGFGLVINESLSCGTPVIASSNSGAYGYISDGIEGYVYPYSELDSLSEKLDQLLSKKNLNSEMSVNSYNFAQKWTWKDYRVAYQSTILNISSLQR